MYFVNVTIHVLAAMVWVGGMLFLALVGAPVLRTVEPTELRADLFRKLGTRFRTVGRAALVVLLVTGVMNLHFRGLLRPGVLSSADFWGTPYGQSLAWKLVSVLLMVAFSVAHDSFEGPAAAREAAGAADAVRVRRKAALLARFAAIAGIIAVIAAVRLARGG